MLNLQGGRLILKGAANAAEKESISSINVIPGSRYVYMESGTGPKATLALDAGSLGTAPARPSISRTQATPWAAAATSSSSPPRPPTPPKAASSPTPPTASSPSLNRRPIPGSQPVADYASYDTVVAKSIVNGSSNYSSTLTNGSGVVELNGPGKVPRLSTAITIDALVLRNGSTVTIAGGGSLTLTSGPADVRALRPSAAIVTSGGGGPLAFAAEGVVMAYSPTTIGTAITRRPAR